MQLTQSSDSSFDPPPNEPTSQPPIHPVILFLAEKLGWVLGILGLILLVAPLFVAITVPVATKESPLGLIPIVVIEVILFALFAAISAIGGVYTAWKHNQENQLRAEVTGEPLEDVPVEIPAFGYLFKRRFLTGIIFLPGFLLVVSGFMSALTGMREGEFGSRSQAKLMISVVMLVTVVGGGVWFRISGWIANRLTGEQDALPTGQAIANGVKKFILGSLGHMAVYLVFVAAVAIPMGLGLLFRLPVPVVAMLLIASLLALAMGVFYYFPKWLEKRSKTMLEQAILEEYGAESPEMQQFKEHEAIQTKSIEGRTNSRMGLVIAGVFGFIMVGMVVVGLVVGSMDLEGQAREAAGKVGQIIVLGTGMLLMFGFIGRAVPDNTVSTEYAEKITTAIRTADYVTAIQLAEESMKALPNWETKVLGGAAYGDAGQSDKAEEIFRAGLRELMDLRAFHKKQDSSSADAYDQSIGAFLVMIAITQINQGRYAEAGQTLAKALQFEQKDAMNYIMQASASLHQGKAPEIALQHLDKAMAIHKAKPQESTLQEPLYLAFRAWAVALQGNKQEANELMLKATELVDKTKIPSVGEIYYIGGFVALAQKRTNAAQVSFNRAIKIDPEGMNGMLARQALETMS